MNSRIYSFLLVLSACMVLVSCNKEPEVVTGDAEVTYESGEYLNLLTNFKLTPNSGVAAKLFVDNADPYRDLVGNIIHKNADSDGASKLALSDLNCTTIYMDCRDEVLLDSFLVDARLVVFDEAAGQRTVLGDLFTFNTGTTVLEFNINSGDFADFFTDFSTKELFFEFDLNGLPTSEIDVTYQLTIGATYSYELEK